MTHAAPDHQLAQVHLQAAVAEAALGEIEQATARLDTILALGRADLLAMARVTADFMDSVTLTSGNEWATGQPADQGGEQSESLDERVSPERALTLRLMSAWSSEDPASFDALFTAAAGDRFGREHLRDLFVYALLFTQREAAPILNPQVMVKNLCKALNKHAPSHWAWNRPQD